MWILGKWEPSWKPGDPARQEGEKAGSWHQTVEEDRHSGMPQNTGDGLATTPSDVYAQSECHCALCNNYYTNNLVFKPLNSWINSSQFILCPYLPLAELTQSNKLI